MKYFRLSGPSNDPTGVPANPLSHGYNLVQQQAYKDPCLAAGVQVYYGHNLELEQHFGCSGPFWGRQYYFWHNGAPLTLIHEVFSNKLDAYLGEAVKQELEAVHEDQQMLQQLWQVESGDWS